MIFRWGSAPDPAGGAHDVPPDPLVGWGEGYPLPISHPPRRLRRLDPRRLEFGPPPTFQIKVTPLERTQVRISSRSVVFITTVTAIYSLEHGLCTLTAVTCKIWGLYLQPFERYQGVPKFDK